MQTLYGTIPDFFQISLPYMGKRLQRLKIKVILQGMLDPIPSESSVIQSAQTLLVAGSSQAIRILDSIIHPPGRKTYATNDNYNNLPKICMYLSASNFHYVHNEGCRLGVDKSHRFKGCLTIGKTSPGSYNASKEEP